MLHEDLKICYRGVPPSKRVVADDTARIARDEHQLLNDYCMERAAVRWQRFQRIASAQAASSLRPASSQPLRQVVHRHSIDLPTLTIVSLLDELVNHFDEQSNTFRL